MKSTKVIKVKLFHSLTEVVKLRIAGTAYLEWIRNSYGSETSETFLSNFC